MRARGSAGRSLLNSTTDRNALASVSSASSARSTLPHTPTATKPTIRAKRIPIGGSIPAETPLKATARSPCASRITTA
jgi:hypothetical protein